MKTHLKRIAAPKSWKIKRKQIVWLVKNRPGAHKSNRGVPLAVLIRDLLGFAKTMKEVKNILTKKTVIVNGKRRRDPKMPVGLMDVVQFPDIGESFRIVISPKGLIIAKRIEKKTDADLKIFKIKNKTLVKGKVQLNLTSSANVLVDKDVYKTGDSLVMNPAKNEIKEHIKFEKGVIVYLTGGSNIGKTGTVEKIEGGKIMVKIDGNEYETPKKYAFVIGKDKPAVQI